MTVELIMLAYFAWAMYAGWKYMDGRVPALEKKGIGYKAIKIVCAYIVGVIYGAIYIIILILKFLGFMSKI